MKEKYCCGCNCEDCDAAISLRKRLTDWLKGLLTRRKSLVQPLRPPDPFVLNAEHVPKLEGEFTVGAIPIDWPSFPDKKRLASSTERYISRLPTGTHLLDVNDSILVSVRVHDTTHREAAHGEFTARLGVRDFTVVEQYAYK